MNGRKKLNCRVGNAQFCQYLVSGIEDSVQHAFVEKAIPHPLRNDDIHLQMQGYVKLDPRVKYFWKNLRRLDFTLSMPSGRLISSTFPLIISILSDSPLASMIFFADSTIPLMSTPITFKFSYFDKAAEFPKVPWQLQLLRRTLRGSRCRSRRQGPPCP